MSYLTAGTQARPAGVGVREIAFDTASVGWAARARRLSQPPVPGPGI
jgi:hypothetical protein